MTAAEEAAELLLCKHPVRCGAGAFGGNWHYQDCPASLIPVLTAALRARQMAGRREAIAVAETEPEPDGKMPDDFHHIPTEDIVRAMVRATRTCIAERIAALPEVP